MTWREDNEKQTGRALYDAWCEWLDKHGSEPVVSRWTTADADALMTIADERLRALRIFADMLAARYEPTRGNGLTRSEEIDCLWSEAKEKVKR